MLRSLCALGVFLALLPSARAAEKLVIVPSRDRQPGLLLPGDFLKKHQVQPRKQEVTSWQSPSLPTLIAGLALTTGLVLSGVQIARRKSARLITGSASCVLGLLLFLNSSCSPRPTPNDREDLERFTDRRSPVTFRAVHGPQLQQDGTLNGEVLLEEGKSGDALRLFVDTFALEAFVERHTAKPHP